MTHTTRTRLTAAIISFVALSATSAAAMSPTEIEPAPVAAVPPAAFYDIDTRVLKDWRLDAPQTDAIRFTTREYVRDMLGTVDVSLAGPIRFSVMEERVARRFGNNINDRGPIIQSLDHQQYLRSTVAAAGVKLTF